jgi:catechol 2,3-dioxygenase-like lactoylglutathione lyase family enzyme
MLEVKSISVFVLLSLVGILISSLSFLSAEESGAPRIFRVILPVSNMDQAVKFYTELLGIKGVSVSGGRYYLHCGGVILALVNPRADGDDWDPRPNQDHVYFAVSDLEAVYERAKRVGGLSTEGEHGNMGKIEKRPWGERSFYMKDPSGNPICFVDEKTLFTGK